MTHLLLAIIYLSFISLGLPDALLGAAWPIMGEEFGVPVSFAGSIHSTPEHFGADNSQALIGVQMAAAYVGSCLMPPAFGLIANHISVALFPAALLIILLLMILMHEQMLRHVERVSIP